MQLRGVATALYEKMGKTVVSLTTLDSTGPDDIYIVGTRKMEVEPRENMRNALTYVLDEVCRQDAQMYQVGDKTIYVPLPVVFGIPRHYPQRAYSRRIQNAFPEYFRRKNANKRSMELEEKLFLGYFKDNGQQNAFIELEEYYLYPPDRHDIRPDELLCGIVMEKLLDAARHSIDARSELVDIAKRSARRCANGINVDRFRFFQYGLHTPEFQANPAYTFLEHYGLKDVFADELIGMMDKPHNICVKTPNDRPAPAFSDICATYMVDQWDYINGSQRKRNVSVRLE